MKLPGDYAAPRGALLLAMGQTRVAGCVGLRPQSDETGEIKRLYVTPSERGSGHARALLDALVAEASKVGYRQLVLETLESMRAARALYAAYGFTIDPIQRDDANGVIAMRLPLAVVRA